MQYGANLYCTKKLPRDSQKAKEASEGSSTDERSYLYWSTKYVLLGDNWKGLNGTTTQASEDSKDEEKKDEEVSYEFKIKDVLPFQQRENEENRASIRDYTIVISYERIQKIKGEEGEDPKEVTKFAIVKIDWSIDTNERELKGFIKMKDDIWLDIKYQVMTYSWRHVFMFVTENKQLKFWAFKDASEKVEDVEWREDFIEMFNKVEPQLFAVQHGNVTKVIAIAGTFLHAFDFYEHGLTFEEAIANAQQTFNIQSLKNESQ